MLTMTIPLEMRFRLAVACRRLRRRPMESRSAIAAHGWRSRDGGRLHWGPEVPVIIRRFGLRRIAIGFWLVVDAMKPNRYFSALRFVIQDERGHRVVDQGLDACRSAIAQYLGPDDRRAMAR